ncbi:MULTISPECIES: NAD(P)/FAD-dependent oxidoreductase [Kocuria]|uniref:FAD-dependent oxidoreductase n=1 Tax=Kocuria subflava TaxID=1736139 RepID=A0A846TUG6_9MICC|nr:MULTISPECIES: FAD-dependent oxidoreductase [Kocuria]NKE10680.1 FAD-dependent oxidoreductase [Kocuria subflava]
MSRTRIIIVGAGYAGITAANRLAARGHQVVLVNGRPDFVERIRLHELAAGSARGVTRPLSAMVGRGVDVVIERATALYPDRMEIELASGRVEAADHIILATGSDVGGGVRTLESAREARGRIARLGPGSHVQVAGAGPTGVEVAAELAEARPDLHVGLNDPSGVLPSLPSRHRAGVEATLTRLGVSVTGAVAGEDVAYEIDCTGFSAAGLAGEAGLQTDGLGRVLVTPTLQVVGHPRVWAVGDCAAVEGQPWLRMSCAAATPMGAHVADGIHRSESGLSPAPLDIGFAALCMSLGRHDGLVAGVDRRDAPQSFVVRGRVAASVKEAICRLAARAPRWTRGRFWLRGAA